MLNNRDAPHPLLTLTRHHPIAIRLHDATSGKFQHPRSQIHHARTVWRAGFVERLRAAEAVATLCPTEDLPTPLASGRVIVVDDVTQKPRLIISRTREALEP